MTSDLTSDREAIRIRRGLRGLASTWLPVAIGLTLVALESTPAMSGENTSHWLRPLFTFLFGKIEDLHWGIFHHALRKSGHFTGYGTLGLVWLRAWLRTFAARREWTLRHWRLVSVALGIAGTFLTASADEWHQTFLPSRTGQFSDVLLDTCGAMIFIAILAVRWRQQQPQAEQVPC